MSHWTAQDVIAVITALVSGVISVVNAIQQKGLAKQVQAHAALLNAKEKA